MPTTTEKPKIPGLRRADLRTCASCGRGLLHDNNLAAYRVQVTQYMADMGAIQQAVGMEMMLGGGDGPSWANHVAHAMGPDSELLLGVSHVSALFCQDCFIDPERSIGEAWELAGKAEDTESK